MYKTALFMYVHLSVMIFIEKVLYNRKQVYNADLREYVILDVGTPKNKLKWRISTENQ